MTTYRPLMIALTALALAAPIAWSNEPSPMPNIQDLSPDASSKVLTDRALQVHPDWIIHDELLDPDTFRARITFERNRITEGITAGHVLISEGEMGLLDEVLSVEVNTDTLVVETEPAALSDAIETLVMP